jgi:hemerythrin-like domain-containing protein
MVAGLQNYIEDLEDDHRRFAEALSDPAALESIALQAQLRDHHHHIAIEEYDCFPAAAKHLSEEQRQPLSLLNAGS